MTNALREAVAVAVEMHATVLNERGYLAQAPRYVAADAVLAAITTAGYAIVPAPSGDAIEAAAEVIDARWLDLAQAAGGDIYPRDVWADLAKAAAPIIAAAARAEAIEECRLIRIRGLLQAMVEGDPDDDAADAVTCWMVWQKEAVDLLAVLGRALGAPRS